MSLSLALALAAGAEQAAESPPIEDEIVVRGVRTGVFEPIPGAHSDVIATDAFTGENRDLAELLADEAGVSVRRFGAAGDRSEVSIRGSTASQVVVTLDGVRANSSLSGGFDLSRVCLPLLEQVEVVRGAGASQVGSGAVGGVVNLVTRAAGSQPTARAEASAGSFDTFEGSVLYADRFEPMDATLGYCGFDTEGDFEFTQPSVRGDGAASDFEPRHATRLNNDRSQHAATLGLGREWAPGELRLTSYLVHSEGGEPGFDGASDPTAGQNTEARSRDLANLAQLRWRGSPHAALGDDLELAVFHRYERSEFEDPVAVVTDPIDVTARLQTAGLRERSRWHRDFSAHRAEWGLQLDGAQDRLSASDRRSRQREIGAASLDGALRLWAERAVLSASGRFEATGGFAPAWLPQAGIVLSPWRWLRLRGQAGRAWRVPSFDELFHPDQGFITGNPDLEPEDAWNFDAGAELALDALGPLSDLELGATLFRREIDESIVWLQVSPSTLRPANTGSATSQGLELEARLALTRFLRARAAQTWTDSERDATGRRLPGQPDRETLVRLELGPGHFWKLVGEMRRTGEILVNEGGSRRIPERTVWNASAALDLAEVEALPFHRWARELWVYFEANNLGDEAVRDSVAFPQPGLNATAGFEWHW